MRTPSPRTGARRDERGQILVIAAIAMLAMIGGMALVVEAGNAYAHQRVAQNAADSMANAGATVLAERLGGAAWITDADVSAAMDRMRDANDVDAYEAFYTNVTGGMVASDGSPTTSESTAVRVGSGAIPPATQGVRVSGSQAFGTTFARALGFTTFTASADATAVTGALTGGQFMPVVFPVSLADCDGSGNLVEIIDSPWRMSNPGNPHPDGQEWLVPLCKTGAGSFMFLDLDDNLSCYEEVMTPPRVAFDTFPVYVDTDTGADCQKKVFEAMIDKNLQGQVVTIPICDVDCSTTGGTTGTYKIARITAFFVDYIAFKNGGQDPACAYTTSPTYGTELINIVGGNGSSACMAGWFVRYVTSGPVGSGDIVAGEAIGVQLIR